jgi:hypothetical protein
VATVNEDLQLLAELQEENNIQRIRARLKWRRNRLLEDIARHLDVSERARARLSEVEKEII